MIAKNVLMRRIHRVAGAMVCSGLLAGCSMFSSSDERYEPAPLTPIETEVTVDTGWSVKIGNRSGAGFAPAFTLDAVYAATQDGSVAKVDLASGSVQWRASLDERL